MNQRIPAAVLWSLAIAATAAQFDLSPPEPHAANLDPLSQLPLKPSQRKEIKVALATGDFKRAETILVEQINNKPDSAELLLYAARLFLRDKDAVNASIAFKKAEKLRPLGRADRFAMATAFLGIGRPAWAKPELLLLAQEEPGNSKYQYWLARIDYDDRQYDSAIQRFQLVTARTPGFVRAWDNLGLSLEGAGRLNEAIESYRRAVELNRTENPPSAWPPLNLGILLTKMAQLDDGERLLREALKYDTQLAQVHLKLGVNLQQQGKKEEAVVELKKSVELAPSDPSPFYALSQIYRNSGDEKAAEEALQRFRALKKVQRGS